MSRVQEQASPGRKDMASAPPTRLTPDPRPANGRPRVHVTLSSSQRKTQVRVQVDWCGRLSGPATARLLAVLVLVLTATAVAMLAHDELVRGVLYTLAGFLTGSRPGTRS